MITISLKTENVHPNIKLYKRNYIVEKEKQQAK